MCCLFGVLDYKNIFSSKNKNVIISVLSEESEARGTDATGIAYNINSQLCVYKRPLSAHMMHFSVPSNVKYIMGHTRMTTQGCEKRNFNNHPFLGSINSGKFALSHNGVLYNDIQLRKSESLPQTKIETDSFVAVQLLEKQNALNFGSLKNMAEKVKGSFCFTVIDRYDNIYIVKGNNPFCLYRFPKHGFYLYASTDDVLNNAIKRLGMQKWQNENILLSYGDILRIDQYGKVKYGGFDDFRMNDEWEYSGYNTLRMKFNSDKGIKDNSYLHELKSVAYYYGYSPSDIDFMVDDGFSCDEIEDILINSHFAFQINERSDG